MPRLARTVYAEVPHHITHRGNRREDVFFDEEDYQTYLEWLHYYSKQHQLEILAYCLMTNHVHLVAVPGTEISLQQVLKPLHMRYARRINRRNRWEGALLARSLLFISNDQGYMWSAIRYVERNPVRARMVRKAERYPWSSASGHCGLTDDSLLTTLAKWKNMTDQVDNGFAWLAGGDEDNELSLLRRNIEKGLPCGSDRFINKLEKLAGRSLHFKAQGRPKHEE